MYVRIYGYDIHNEARSSDFTITINSNSRPTISGNLVTKYVNIGGNFIYDFSVNISGSDVDGDTVYWLAKQSNGNALPSWLKGPSTSTTMILAGTPASSNRGSITVRIYATDSINSSMNYKDFSLKVNGQPAFSGGGFTDQNAIPGNSFSYK